MSFLPALAPLLGGVGGAVGAVKSVADLAAPKGIGPVANGADYANALGGANSGNSLAGLNNTLQGLGGLAGGVAALTQAPPKPAPPSVSSSRVEFSQPQNLIPSALSQNMAPQFDTSQNNNLLSLLQNFQARGGL